MKKMHFLFLVLSASSFRFSFSSKAPETTTKKIKDLLISISKDIKKEFEKEEYEKLEKSLSDHFNHDEKKKTTEQNQPLPPLYPRKNKAFEKMPACVFFKQTPPIKTSTEKKDINPLSLSFDRLISINDLQGADKEKEEKKLFDEELDKFQKKEKELEELNRKRAFHNTPRAKARGIQKKDLAYSSPGLKAMRHSLQDYKKPDKELFSSWIILEKKQ